MRRGSWWTIVGIIMLLLSGNPSIGASRSSAIDRNSATDQGGPWATSLAKDDVYRRDGVIKDMRTCLLVAADDHAYALWSDRDEWHSKDVPSLSMTLYQQRLSEGKKPGFGTVWACSQILEAWHTSLPGRSKSDSTYSIDGRVEHGATVIDLALGDHDRRAVIDPLPLVRLLTSANLLPSWAFGGIVVRNAEVRGTLLLHNLHLSMPLAFANVRFIGGDYRKEVYKIKGQIKDAAISILHSRFNDHVLFSASEICGKVIINNSYFADKLEWQGITQKSNTSMGRKSHRSYCVSSDDLEVELKSGFYSYNSNFSQSLEIKNSHLGSFISEGNRINRFYSRGTNFGSSFDFVDSDVGSFLIYGRLASKNTIEYNRIANDFFVYGSEEFEPEIQSLEINSNRIGGGIGFLRFPSNSLPNELSLESNHVGNGSLICLPRNWTGRVSLAGSVYDGMLSIGLTDPNRRKADGKNLKCGGINWNPIRFTKDENDYCEDVKRSSQDGKQTQEISEQLVQVNLEAVDVRTLIWELPLLCKYRWTGFGLKYRLWRPEASAAKTISEQTGDWEDLSWLRVFRAWRTTLLNHEPAPLDTMSRYLIDNGDYVASRQLLLEAKRLNYAPDCKPNSSLADCASQVFREGIWGYLKNKWNILGNALLFTSTDARADATEQASGSSGQRPAPSFWKQIRSFATLILLWPGGYGAEPERAILLIIGCAVGFFAVYCIYSAALRRNLKQVPTFLRNKVFIDSRPINDTPESSNQSAGTGTRHDGSAPARTQSSTTLRLPWPQDEDWGALGVSERLTMVQDRLLPELDTALAECDRKDIKSELKILHRNLERFGNTEMLGFSRFDRGKMPRRFTRWLYSVDTMMPFIDLHAYGNYYPESGWIRTVSILQHVLGWWLLTVFIASAAIL